MPTVADLIVRVELAVPPDVRVTLAGVRDAVSPLEEERVRKIVPVKPFMEVKVIIEVLVLFGVVLMIVGFALTVKSWTVNVKVVEWDRLLLLPVTVTE